MSEFLSLHFEMLAVFGATLAVCFIAAWAIIYYVFYAVRSQILGVTTWCGNDNNNFVALTFDDGPSADTLDILDFLRDENVKATFFLIGKQVEKHPAITKRIVADGHEIGNHSYSHPIFLFCSPGKMRRELEKTQEIIKNIVGFAPKLARPPCGVRTQAYFSAAKDLGLRTIQWSDAGFDWQKISAEKIAEKVLKTAQSDSIILLHDGDSALKNNRRETVKSLPLIIEGLRAKNLRIAPLAELIGESQPEKTNFKGEFNPI